MGEHWEAVSVQQKQQLVLLICIPGHLCLSSCHGEDTVLDPGLGGDFVWSLCVLLLYMMCGMVAVCPAFDWDKVYFLPSSCCIAVLGI